MSPGRTSEPLRGGAAFGISADELCSFDEAAFDSSGAASESFGTVALGVSVPNCAAELLFKSLPS
jgi:hypothetical protein